MDRDDLIRLLLTEQDGLLTLQQAFELGLTRNKVRWLLGTRWQLVLPRVILAGRGPLSRRQRLIAGLLYAGEGAMLTSLSAASFHGIIAANDPAVYVEVPASRRPRGAGFVVVRRTVRPEQAPWHRDPLLVVSRPRAVVEAAREVGDTSRATAIVCEAVQRELVTLDGLRHELEAGPRRGSAVVRSALAAAEAGAWSRPEAGLLELAATSKVLPRPWLNPRLETVEGLRLPTPDAWFDGVALAVQVHSWQYHSSYEQWNDTVMADGVLTEHGIVVVGVTPVAIGRSPAQVLRRMENSHRQAALRSRPPVVARPRSLVSPASAGPGTVRDRPRLG